MDLSDFNALPNALCEGQCWSKSKLSQVSQALVLLQILCWY